MNDKTKKKTTDLEVVQGMFQTFKSSHIGIPNISEAVYYTQQEADAHNAELTGALDSTTPLTAEQAAAYNEAVTGATKEAGDTLSAEEAAAYNATLDGAVTTADVKTAAVPKKVKDYVDDGLAGKADKLPMTGAGAATENNFMAIDANGNIKDSGKKASDFLTQHQDISGKADKSEMSITDGTGANADKTTIQLKSGLSRQVLTTHQDISGKEDKTNKVTSISSSSTDTQYPSAKCVYDNEASLKSQIDFVRQQLLVDDPDRVIMTTETNPEVLAVCHAQGWCANAGYMTYAEAQAVTDIGLDTFENNTSITHFEELQYFGITSFKDRTFNGCSNLTSIGIPPSLINFTGSDTFKGCTKLANVYIRDLSKYLGANVSGSYNTDSLPQKAINCYLYINNQRVTTLVIPTDVTAISHEILRRYVFDEVVIPSTHANLSWGYGSGSCRVSKVSVNDTLDNFIGTGYLYIDPRLESDPKYNANGNIYFNGVKPEGAVTVPDGTTSIGVSALCGLTSVTSVSIPNTVTEIKDMAFAKTEITSITMPDSVTVIGSQLFVEGPITYISTNALAMMYNSFSRLPSLETLVLRNTNITSLDEYAFRQNNFRNLYLYAQTAPTLYRKFTTPWPYQGTKTLYVPANSTGYDTGKWKECFLDLGWTLSKTL